MPTAQTFHDIVSGRRRGVAGFLARTLLGVAEVPYRAVVGARNRRYDRSHAEIVSVDVPVISVGNLTLGGTGKTPMVAWLARWFRKQGIRVAIVSRGYRADQDGQNDEARELEQLLPDVPHLQNPDRVAAAQVAIQELEAQVIILDDGFQHRRLARDLDIVLLDASEPFGHGHVFPRGLLREPIAGLARADCIALTRSDMIEETSINRIRNAVGKQRAASGDWLELIHRPHQLMAFSGLTASLESLQGKQLAAFCGIGNPEGFRHTLTTCGWTTPLKTFPDHHNYTADDLQELRTWVNNMQPRCDALLCTHKDLVKIGVDQLAGTPVWAVTIQIQIENGEDTLVARLQKFCKQAESP